MKTFFESISLYKSLIVSIAFGAIFLFLFKLGLTNFLLLHVIMEMFAIIISFGIFIFSWNTKKFHNNSYLFVIGSTYLSVGILDFLHVISYDGMQILHSVTTPDIATKFWISARYLESIGFLIANFAWKMKYDMKKYLIITIVITMLIIYLIFNTNIFPLCYSANTGLTNFKIVSEYVIISILLLSVLYRKKIKNIEKNNLNSIIDFSIYFTIISEFSFTLYFDVLGIINLIGHILKFISFYLIYKAVIEMGLKNPYSILFEKIVKRENELVSKNEELEAFNYTLSHDLKNSLFIVVGKAENILDEYKDRIDENIKEQIEKIISTSFNMNYIITNLLRLSIINSDNINKTKINITELVEKIINDYKDKGAVFEIQKDMEIYSDIGLLDIIYRNLIENAVKYTPDIRKGRIIIGFNAQSNEFYVKDNGIGFDVSNAEDIFKPFKRLENSKKISGSGIGLNSVWKSVKALNGNIRFESQKNKGTTFFFSL